MTMKILLINAWGGNRGDEAQINSLFRLIKGIYPAAIVHIMAFRDEKLNTDEEMTQIRNRCGTYFYSSLNYSFNKHINSYKCRSVVSFINKIADRPSFLKKYDLIISSPQGPSIGDMYDLKARTLYPLGYAKEYGIPYCIAGVSMGPFMPISKDDDYVFDVLQGAGGIIVREDISVKYLKDKYPRLNNVISSIDVVFATDVNIMTKNPTLNDQYQLFCETIGPGSIGACISLTPPKDPSNYFNKDEYIAKMILFFDFVIEYTGRALILLPHLYVDMPALLTIKNDARNADKISILPEYFDSDFQQDFIKNHLEFFIASRYHPTVFSIKAETPFLCIKNQFKAEGLLSKLKLDSDACWQDDSLGVMKETLVKCWTGRTDDIGRIKTAHRTAREEALEYGRLLTKFLKSLN